MALQKTLKLIDNYGIEVEIKDAYIKVERIEASKNAGQATVYIFNDRNRGSIKTERFEFPVDLAGSNFIRQAYEHMKQLPEYVDAVDC